MEEFWFNPRIHKYLDKILIGKLSNLTSKERSSISPDRTQNLEDLTQIDFICKMNEAKLHWQQVILKNGLKIMTKGKLHFIYCYRTNCRCYSKAQVNQHYLLYRSWANKSIINRNISPEKALIFDFYKDSKFMEKLANDYSIKLPSLKGSNTNLFCREIGANRRKYS